jgi:phage baseplate assembly protein W
VSNAAINLGTCWGTPDGQDLSMPSYMASGLQCVAEAILRRWSTSQGELIDDPNYGYNLTDLINDDLSPTQLAYAAQQAAAQAQLDERVLQCAVQLTLTVAGLLTVVANVITAAGPFQLVLAVSAVTTKILLVSP